MGSVIKQMTTEADASVANYDGNAHERRRIIDGVAYSEELQGSVRELLRYAKAFMVACRTY